MFIFVLKEVLQNLGNVIIFQKLLEQKRFLLVFWNPFLISHEFQILR
jgi:hypothetical protein